MVTAWIVVTESTNHVLAHVCAIHAAALLVLALVDDVHVEQVEAIGGQIIEEMAILPVAIPGYALFAKSIRSSSVSQDDQELLAARLEKTSRLFDRVHRPTL